MGRFVRHIQWHSNEKKFPVTATLTKKQLMQLRTLIYHALNHADDINDSKVIQFGENFLNESNEWFK